MGIINLVTEKEKNRALKKQDKEKNCDSTPLREEFQRLSLVNLPISFHLSL
jgi:hypothetical protein